MIDKSKSSQRLWLGWMAVASSLLTAPLGAQLLCDGVPEGFSQGIPAGWTALDGTGSGLVWGDLAACGEGANFTGGDGAVVCASSDQHGFGAFDTELRSPLFDLSAAADPVLRFAVDFQSFAGSDRLDVDLSTDQGVSWTTLQSLREDYGVFRSTPGETLEVDLSAYSGQSGLQLRFRYHDPEEDAFDWYAQIDDVSLSCNVSACEAPPVTGLVSDGGFEGGTPSVAWTESSPAFGTPLCTAASCGFAGASSGDGWAFFGGSPSGGLDALDQTVTLPFGVASLSFHLWIPAASGNGTDVLRVLFDGQEVFAAGEGERRFRPGYRRVELDVSPFADGGSHNLRIESSTSGSPSHTSFFVDDVAITICTAVVEKPGISIDNVVLDEGNSGRRDAVLTVSLSGASRDVVTVAFATADGSARATSDYDATSGTLSFPRGTRTRTIAVPVRGDTVDEPTETFLVNLSNATNGVLTDTQGLVTVANDDFAFLSIRSIGALERDEGETSEVVFTVALSTPSSQTVLVGYESSDGTATAGLDYTAVSGTLTFAPGTTRKTVAVTILGDIRVERDETFFVDISGPINAAIDEPRAQGKILDNDRGRFPVEGTDVFYTETVDFELGRFLNTTTDVPDQVQLTRVKRTFPNIWVAASSRGTVVRVDTRTGAILGEYSTNPDAGSASSPNPSRTTVGLDGSVWAGNRGDGSVIHVGLPEENQCIDRNGNGTIETSSGYGDVLAWPNAGGSDSDGGVETALDECILHYVKVSSSVTRHLSVDRDNNIWVSGLGGRNARVFDLVDGDSGAVLRTEGPFACGGYGGLVDANGVLWSAQYNSAVLRWDPAVVPPTSQSLRCITGVASYGLAIDPDGDVWVAGPSGDRIWEISGDGTTVRGPFQHGSAAAQGLAVDALGEVWVSSAKWGGSATIGHVRGDGTFVGNVTGVPRGSSGVAVDIDGNVWTANAASSSLSRINPLLGPIGADGVTRIGLVDMEVALPGSNPYNYSDMTGSLALASTSPRGTWQVIQDAGFAGALWGTVTWNMEAEGHVPAGGAFLVEARTADTQAGLGAATFAQVANGVSFDLEGRFLQVRATLRPDAADVSPVLSDLRITLGDPVQGQPFSVTIDNQTVFESDSGTLDAVFNVNLDAPSDGTVEVYYDVFEGSATEHVDYTPRSGRLMYPPGIDTQELAITVFGDTDPEDDETFFIKLRDPTNVAILDAVGVGTIIDDDLRLEPVVGDCVHYTLDGEFDQGKLFNTHHDAPSSDQLQVTEEVRPFPFLWVAGSGRGTVIKIDTRTGAVLGEYSSTPDNRNSHNPSRTTVTLDGSVWAGNRGDGSVIHVGLVEEGQCVDRNGNGVIETSTGYTDLLPWPNPGGVDTQGGVTTAIDECILHYVKTTPSVPRHVSVDGDGNVWVGGYGGSFAQWFNLIDGQTGEILRTEGRWPCGGYGGFVDRDGILWSQHLNGRILRWDPSVVPPTSESLRCVSGVAGYGTALGNEGDVYVTRSSGNRMWKIDKDDLSVQTFFNHGSNCAQGLAVDANEHLWVSSSRWCNGPTVGHLLGDGTFIGNITAPRGSTGVAVDADGKIWVASDQASQAFRIDPNAGPIGNDGVTPIGAIDLVVNIPGARPYNYSDMTGAQVLRNSAPRGTWRAIQDGGEEETLWGEVTWNIEAQASVPEGASITVQARAADTVAGLGGLPFVGVENGVEFALLGRFIEVRATLRPNLAGESPVLSDIQICTAELNQPSISINDVVVHEGDSGSVVAYFEVTLSEAGEDEVLVDFATIDGSAGAGTDYVARTGRLAFAPGETSQLLGIEVLSDHFDEPDETFAIDLSLPRNATLADGQGLGTILDDDVSVSMTVTGVTVTEGDPLPAGSGTVDAVFEIALSGVSNRTVRVDYVTQDDTAEVGSDYQEAFGYLELLPGTTSIEVVVKVFSDLEPEDDETFLLVLSNGDGADLLVSQAVGLILDDDLREMSIDDVTVEEGDTGTVEATFTVSLSRPSGDDVTVEYVTVAGTATEGFDYEAASGVVTFAPGETTATITVLVNGDILLEDDETFFVELSNPVNAILIDGTGDGTIIDDEVCPGPNLLANASNELRPVDGELSGWTPLVGTAAWQRRFAPPAPVDGEATFFPGVQEFAELWQDVDVGAYATLIAGGDQTFAFEGYVRTFEESPSDVAQIVVEYRDAANQVVLASFDSGQITSVDEWQRVEDVRAAPAGTGWIRVRLLATRFTEGDNDAYFDALSFSSLRAAVLTVDDIELYEGDSGTTDAVFTVSLSCPIEGEATIAYTTTDGTAIVEEDFLATSGQLVFPSGTTSLQVAVPVVGDEIHEPHETFFLDTSVVSSDRQVVPVDPRGEGLILNDDFCPRSPGFWKNHTELWPQDYLEIGGVEYSFEELLVFLDANARDATMALARQLVATKLNLLVGSDPFILPAVEAADLFLAEHPPGSNPKGEARQTANALKDELDDYNNPDFCEEVPVVVAALRKGGGERLAAPPPSAALPSERGGTPEAAETARTVPEDLEDMN